MKTTLCFTKSHSLRVKELGHLEWNDLETAAPHLWARACTCEPVCAPGNFPGAKWCPLCTSHIFLSHSHKDVEQFCLAALNNKRLQGNSFFKAEHGLAGLKEVCVNI